MKKYLLLVLLASSSTAMAQTQPVCYQLSSSKNVWSKTPEMLCIEGQSDDYTLTLKTGLPFNSKVIATFNMNLLQRARCIDCNKDVYGISNPSNSTFNALAIQFNGARDLSNKEEKGTVTIGSTVFYYRNY